MTMVDRFEAGEPTKLIRNGDTRIYIRVQQEDGHRIWTSPIYLFRK